MRQLTVRTRSAAHAQVGERMTLPFSYKHRQVKPVAEESPNRGPAPTIRGA